MRLKQRTLCFSALFKRLEGSYRFKAFFDLFKSCKFAITTFDTYGNSKAGYELFSPHGNFGFFLRAICEGVKPKKVYRLFLAAQAYCKLTAASLDDLSELYSIFFRTAFASSQKPLLKGKTRIGCRCESTEFELFTNLSKNWY